MSNSQWHGGKGSGRRTASIPDSEMSARWDAIFGKKKNKNTTEVEPPLDKPEQEKPE